MSLTTRFHQTTTIKIPKDIWQLIIDKIEPEPYKLPTFIPLNHNKGPPLYIRSSEIIMLKGPIKGNAYDFIGIYIMKKTAIDYPDFIATSTDDAFVFDLLLSTMKQYKNLKFE